MQGHQEYSETRQPRDGLPIYPGNETRGGDLSGQALLWKWALWLKPRSQVMCLPFSQCSPVTHVGTPGGCPTASSRAQPSTSGTRSATAATPASSWRATPCSPATLARRTAPRGTSPCPPAEVGGQRGSEEWAVTGNAGASSGTWSLRGRGSYTVHSSHVGGACYGERMSGDHRES